MKHNPELRKELTDSFLNEVGARLEDRATKSAMVRGNKEVDATDRQTALTNFIRELFDK